MKEFPKIKGKLLFDEPLSRHTTFRIGGPTKIWAEPCCEDDLKKILKFARREKKPVFTIGMGSNVLFNDRTFDGVSIHLGESPYKKVRFAGTKVIAGSGIELGKLVNLACMEGLSGLEGLVGIPGTLGGAVFMNSSYRGSMSDIIEEVKIINTTTQKIETIKRKDIDFGYRNSGDLRNHIILEASLGLEKSAKERLLKLKKKLLDIKISEQPLGVFSAGCIFKNPKAAFSAARYIEMSRLKGKRIGDAKVSERHANFIVNLKSAKASDVFRLINFIKKRVKSQFGVDLETEIIII